MALLDETTDDALAQKRKKRLAQSGININAEGSVSIMRSSMSPTIPGASGRSAGGFGPSLVTRESLAPTWTRSANRAANERKQRLMRREG